MLKLMKRSTRSTVSVALAMAIALACGAAFAQAASPAQTSPIQISNAVFQEVVVKTPDGKTTNKLVPATNVVPGGEVVYEIKYNNTGKAVATDVAITNPVAKELTFVDVVGTPVTSVSIDNGKSFGQLTQLAVSSSDGSKRPAQASDVTTLQWIVPAVQPGATGKVSFRARVK